jgi:hypothetical protein
MQYRISIHNENGWLEEITIDSATLAVTDSTGCPVEGHVPTRAVELIEDYLACAPTGRHGRDGRDYLACGSIANPAGYCCEHGTPVGCQPQGRPVVTVFVEALTGKVAR